MARNIEDLAGSGNGGGGDLSTLTISGSGFDFDFDGKVVLALEVFDRIRSGMLYSYAEAKVKVQEMGIKLYSEYMERYVEDRRLPSNPQQSYAGTSWVSWPMFLRNEAETQFYSYAEAKAKVQEMGIRTNAEYRTGYKRDLRLRSDPDTFYRGKGWVSWPMFLRNEAEIHFYSYAEAKAKVQDMGITSQRDYRQKREDHPLLPSNPNMIYKDTGWVSWPMFLRNEAEIHFYSYAEAKAKVQEMGISLRLDYKKRKGEDLRLPGAPDRFYKDNGWISWPVFLGRE
jgi:hypothetical protein